MTEGRRLLLSAADTEKGLRIQDEDDWENVEELDVDGQQLGVDEVKDVAKMVRTAPLDGQWSICSEDRPEFE